MANLRLPDVNLHYQRLGEGHETVVMIHGLGANLAFWYMGIAKSFAREREVLTYDLRGHGRSSLPPSGYSLPYMSNDLDELLRHVEAKKVHLIGHSFGARVALHYAITHPEKIASLTIADTQIRWLQRPQRLREWSYWPTWKSQLQQLGHVDLPSDDEVINFKLLAHFNRLNTGIAPAGWQDNKAGAGPSLRNRDMGQRGSRRWEKLLKETTGEAEFDEDHQITVAGLKNFNAPTLAIYGEHSHCLESGQRLEKLLPNCHFQDVKKAGHFHPAVRPRVFVKMVQKFINGQRHRAGPALGRFGKHRPWSPQAQPPSSAV